MGKSRGDASRGDKVRSGEWEGRTTGVTSERGRGGSEKVHAQFLLVSLRETTTTGGVKEPKQDRPDR